LLPTGFHGALDDLIQKVGIFSHCPDRTHAWDWHLALLALPDLLEHSPGCGDRVINGCELAALHGGFNRAFDVAR
jgi:hypothetical protein